MDGDVNHVLSDCFSNNLDSQSTIFLWDGYIYLVKSITFFLYVTNTKGILLYLVLFAFLCNISVFIRISTVISGQP